MSTGLITNHHPQIVVDIAVYSIVIITIGLKAVLCVFCNFVAKYNNSSAVEAYAQDHFNDIITNSIGIELSKPFKNLNTVTGVNEIINRIGYIRSFLVVYYNKGLNYI